MLPGHHHWLCWYHLQLFNSDPPLQYAVLPWPLQTSRQAVRIYPVEYEPGLEQGGSFWLSFLIRQTTFFLAGHFLTRLFSLVMLLGHPREVKPHSLKFFLRLSQFISGFIPFPLELLSSDIRFQGLFLMSRTLLFNRSELGSHGVQLFQLLGVSYLQLPVILTGIEGIMKQLLRKKKHYSENENKAKEE